VSKRIQRSVRQWRIFWVLSLLAYCHKSTNTDAAGNQGYCSSKYSVYLLYWYQVPEVPILTQQALLGALQDLRDPDKLRTAAHALAAAPALADEVLYEEDEGSEVTLSIKVVPTSVKLSVIF
jgi:hypothetical protein